MAYYRRNLPHWHLDGAGLFIIWRLHGSSPAGCGSLTTPAQTSAGQAFREWDARLDRASSGPTWLKDPRLAAMVVGTIHRGECEKKLYRRLAYVVMSNHVPVLLEPLVSVAKITQWVKGATAREGNRILGREGIAFWQHESHDHWVRNESEGQRIVRTSSPIRC